MSRKNKIVIAIIAVIAVAAIAFFGIRHRMRKPADDNNVIKIGAILPLTGAASFLGEDEKKGIEATKLMLLEKGIAIDVSYQDSSNLSKEGLNAFLKLVNDKNIKAIIVAHSGVANPIVEYLNANRNRMSDFPMVFGILMVSDKIGRDVNIFARCIPTARVQTESLFNYISRREKQIKNIGLIYQDDDYGKDYLQNISTICQGQGMPRLIFAESFDKTNVDAKNIAQKFLSKSKQIDAVFIIGNSSAYASVLRSIKLGGFDGKIFSEASIETPALRKAAGEVATKGIIFSSAYEKNDSAISRKYEALLQKSGVGPSITNAYAAAATMILAEIINGSKKGQNAIELSQVYHQKTFDTVLGKICFDQSRVAIVPVCIKVINDLSPANDSVLKLE